MATSLKIQVDNGDNEWSEGFIIDSYEQTDVFINQYRSDSACHRIRIGTLETPNMWEFDFVDERKVINEIKATVANGVVKASPAQFGDKIETKKKNIIPMKSIDDDDDDIPEDEEVSQILSEVEPININEDEEECLETEEEEDADVEFEDDVNGEDDETEEEEEIAKDEDDVEEEDDAPWLLENINPEDIDWTDVDIFEGNYCPPSLRSIRDRLVDAVTDCAQYSKTASDKDWIFDINCGDKSINQAFINRAIEMIEVEADQLCRETKVQRGRGTRMWLVLGLTEKHVEKRLEMI